MNVKPRRAMALVDLVVIMIASVTLAAIALPTIQQLRESGRREQCANRLGQIGLACLRYEETYAKFPPGRSGRDGHGENGQQSLVSSTTSPHNGGASLFVMLLPFMDNQALYDQLDLGVGSLSTDDLEWTNRPEIVAAVRRPMEIFRCPSDQAAANITDEGLPSGLRPRFEGIDFAVGSYAACIGSNFPGVPNHSDIKTSTNGAFCYSRQYKASDFSDGLSSTILVGEVAGGDSAGFSQFSYWAYAGRITSSMRSTRNPMNLHPRIGGISGFYSKNTPGANGAFRSHHSAGGCNFVFGDGHVSFLDESLELETYHALSTRAMGESISEEY